MSRAAVKQERMNQNAPGTEINARIEFFDSFFK
jgi:hypothetical protein